MVDHLVKLVHASELARMRRLPAYEAHAGKTLAQYKAEKAEQLKQGARPEAAEPVLFVSHRWLSTTHPDPEGLQLQQLQALSSCYLIYDYASFPQDMSRPGAQQELRQVLQAMNGLIDHVLVLADPDYMNRGWCLYEYITAALTHQIVCDEIRDPALVRLRNLVATKPNPPGLGSTYREARNAKSQLVLEAVNAMLPVFAKGQYTVASDREIVQNLLISKLLEVLPRKQEYMPYVGEWKTIEWTRQELDQAFVGQLQWEALQHDPTMPVFEPKVPHTLAGAMAQGFAIEQQPKGFAPTGLDRVDFSNAGRVVLVIQAVAVALLLLTLWGAYRLLRWWLGA
jgi:hypothetical protein